MQRRVEKKYTLLRVFIVTAALMGASLCEVANAFPGPLGLTSGLPDINVLGGVNLDYDAPSATISAVHALPVLSYLSADGLSDQLIFNADYALSATLDSTDNYKLDTSASNTLTIQGDLGLGGGVESLLTANIVDFGFAGGVTGGVGEGVFEFLLNVTSSNSALGFGGHAGVIIASSGLTGVALTALDGTQSFSGNGSSNTYNIVPEPSSILLLLAGLSALFIRQRGQPRAARRAGYMAANA